MFIKPIGHIHTSFPTKFGVPRQSGLVPQLSATITFEPEYRKMEAFRGLEGCSHIWVLWEFSKTEIDTWLPTVRPPRLGGNKRMGVFSTRSPFRPNPIGLSSLKLEKIEFVPGTGPVLHVFGADLMDGTPILDIKPYLAFTDSHPEATASFMDEMDSEELNVVFPENLLERIPKEEQQGLLSILSLDPHPRFKEDPERVYKMAFGSFDISFTIKEQTLNVINVEKKAVLPEKQDCNK